MKSTAMNVVSALAMLILAWTIAWIGLYGDTILPERDFRQIAQFLGSLGAIHLGAIMFLATIRYTVDTMRHVHGETERISAIDAPIPANTTDRWDRVKSPSFQIVP